MSGHTDRSGESGSAPIGQTGSQAPRRLYRCLRLPVLRRVVLLLVMVLFSLQFFKVKVLVGGLSGSLAVWFVSLIDVFAWMESLAASREMTGVALIAVFPVVLVYLLVGRAFCGWVCPMDLLFETAGALKIPFRKMTESIPAWPGYAVAGLFLAGSAVAEIPLFTNYVSHLTNFFRVFTGGVFLALDLPVDVTVIYYSGAVVLGLVLFDMLFPRLWCRTLCPVGTVYGLFNKLSLLRLSFSGGVCQGCNHCNQRCYMGVDIAGSVGKGSLRDVNCIYCGRCVEGCAAKGKLVHMKFTR